MRPLGVFVICWAACSLPREDCHERGSIAVMPSKIEVPAGEFFEVVVTTEILQSFLDLSRGGPREMGRLPTDEVHVEIDVNSFSTVEKSPDVVATVGIGRATLLNVRGPGIVGISEGGFVFTTVEPGSFDHLLTFECTSAQAEVHIHPPWAGCDAQQEDLARVEVRCLPTLAN